MNSFGEHNENGERGTKVPRAFSLGFALVLLLSAANFGLRAEEPLANRPALRRPVTAAVLRDGKTLAVANDRSGTISLVDLEAGRVLGEYPIGARLSGFALFSTSEYALAVDPSARELIALDVSRTGIAVTRRIPLSASPTGLAYSPRGDVSLVSTWSHTVTFSHVSWPKGELGVKLLDEATVELSFAPRLQLWVAPQRLLVADAFGGHLALIDAQEKKILAVHEIAGQNIRGLALSHDGQEVVLTHQILDAQAPTSLENIQRGELMRNVLRRIRVTDLERTEPPLEVRSRIKDLGVPERGAADPAGVVTGPHESAAIALAGVNQVELGRLDNSSPNSAVQLQVGRRPTALVRYGATGLAVLNTFDDSVSLIDLAERRVVRTISLGPIAKLTPQDRGELLFFDGALSPDGWLSCHSCHSEGHTSGRLADTQGDGTFGTPKRTPTLRGTGLTYRWAWNGSQQNLQDQVQKSLEQTMFAHRHDAQVIGDLTAYLVWLPPPPPLEPAKNDPADRAQIARGEKLFHSQGCADCHIPPLVYTSNEVFDVGLADEKGLKKFNPPSLRGVGQSNTFLHDGRAKSLSDVFRLIGHPHGQTLSGPELEDLIRFLNSL